MSIFAVVTRVPDPDQGETGNLAFGFPIYVQVEEPSPGNGWKAKVEPIGKQIGAGILALRTPVFTLGEILVLDGRGGREVAGQQRKPSKWDVDVEYFGNLTDAIVCANVAITADTRRRVKGEKGKG